MLPLLCLLAVVFPARQKTISVPSGHMREFPRSSPISILLGCDTQPDVAAPLASRVGLLTGCPSCSSQGQEGLWCWSTGDTPMMYTGSTLCSLVNNCHIPLIKPLCPASPGGCPLGSTVSCWDSGLVPCNRKCSLTHLLWTFLCFLCAVDIQYTRLSTYMQKEKSQCITGHSVRIE